MANQNAAGYSDYNQYIADNADTLRGARPAAPSAVPAYAPVPAVAEQPQEAVFPLMVKQAEAANGGPITDPQALQTLFDQAWTTEEPNVWASRRGIPKAAVEAEKNRAQGQFEQWRNDYLKQHAGAGAAAATGGNTAKGGAGEFLADLGKSAAGQVGSGVVELARGVGGGLAVIGDKGYEALAHAMGNPNARGELADLAFGGMDNGLKLKALEDGSRKWREEAAVRSPIAAGIGTIAGLVGPGALVKGAEAGSLAARLGPKLAGYLARALPASAAVSVPQTLGTVGDARSRGASVAQQEKLLGSSLVVNTGANLLPGALGGRTGGSLRRALTTAGLSGTVGAAVGVGQQSLEHAIAPDQIPDISLTSTATQGGIAAALGLILNHRVIRTGNTPQTPAVDVSGQPIVDAAGNAVIAPTDVQLPQVPSDVAPAATGPGISDVDHARVVGAAKAAGSNGVDDFNADVTKNPALKDPAARVQAMISHAALHAEEAAGAQWDNMTALQRADAVEAAAQYLGKATNKGVLPEGLGEALQTLRSAVAEQAKPAPVVETGQPDVGTETPLPPEAAATEVPGMESSTLQPGAAETPTPAARATAEAAMAEQAAPASPLAPAAPAEAPGRTTAQAARAGTPTEVQQHADLDTALRTAKKAAPGLGKTITKATLAKMTQADKVKMLADLQGQIDAAAAKAEAAAAKKAKAPLKRVRPNMMDAAEGPPPGSPGTEGLGTEPVRPSMATLPEGLAKAAPRYNFGVKSFTPEFINDVDKAAYVIAGKTKSKAHDQYLDFVIQNTGLDEAGAIALGNRVRERIKFLAKDAPAGTKLQVPFVHGAEPPKPTTVTPPKAVEPTPPKAAASEAAQPPEAEASQAPEANPQPVSEAPTSPSDPVAAALGDAATPRTIADLQAKVDLAREGSTTELNDYIRENRADGTLSAEQAKALRQAGREAPKDSALRDHAEAEARRVQQEEANSLARELEAKTRTEPPTTPEGKAASTMTAKAEALLDRANKLKSDKARVTEAISKLRKELHDTAANKRAVDFLEWVLKKNPALVRGFSDLTVVPREEGMNHVGRLYPVTRILEVVNKTALKPDTIVHELMHATEALLPPPLREAIVRAREAEILRQIGETSPAEKAFFDYLKETVGDAPGGQKAAYMQAAQGELLKLRDSLRSNPTRLMELYALTNSSEYWAVHASDMLHGGYISQSLAAKARQWLSQFMDQLKFLFGDKPNKQPVLDGIKHILSTEDGDPVGPFLRNYELTKAQTSGQPEALNLAAVTEGELNSLVLDPADAVKQDNPRTAGTELVELLANSARGFLRTVEKLRRMAGTVPDELNPYIKFVALTGKRENLRALDTEQTIQPIVDLVGHTYQRFAKDAETAVDKLGMFFQVDTIANHTWPKEWREQTPLSGGREIVRQRILRDVGALKLNPTQGLQQIEALVKQYGQSFDDWAKSAKGKLYDQVKAKQAEFAQQGITTVTTQEFRPLIKAMNEQARKRWIESGKVAADDPWVEFYGDNGSYLPLKGSALDGRTFGSDRGYSYENDINNIQRKDYITNVLQLRTAEGRATWASNPLLRAFVDSTNAAAAVADHSFTGDLKTLITRNKALFAKKVAALDKTIAVEKDATKLAALNVERAKYVNDEFYGAKIHTLEGVPRGGFDDLATGVHYDTLPNIENSFVHNDGRLHYVIEMPKNSDLMHAMRTVNTKFDPREMPLIKPAVEWVERGVNAVTKRVGLGEQTRLISRSTQFLGKANTIWNPVWTGTVQFTRLFTELPVMLAAKEGQGLVHGGLLIAKTYGQIFGGTFQHIDQLGMLLRGDGAALRAAAAKDPNSWAAAYQRLHENGGGSEVTQGLTMHESNNILVRGIRERERGLVNRRLHDYDRYTKGWSNVLENIGRVGVFRALEKEGVSAALAAPKTKDLMNFSQGGVMGPAMNGYKAYFRVTMTGADTLERAFRHPMGRHEVTLPNGKKWQTAYDWQKIGTYVGTFSALAAMKYAFDRSLLGDDENGKPVLAKIMGTNPYRGIERMFVPGASSNPNHPAGLAVGLGIPQILTAPGVLMAAMSYGDITPDEAAKAYMEMLQRNVSPIDPVGTDTEAGGAASVYSYILGALQPTAMSPATSLYTNVDNFGRPIRTAHPVEGVSQADQAKGSTPPVWTEMARTMRDLGVDIYPEQLAYITRNYGGSAANDFLRAVTANHTREQQGLDGNALESTLRLTVQDADYYYSAQLRKTAKGLNETQIQLNAVRLAAGPKGSPEYERAGRGWLSTNPQAQQQLAALAALTSAQKTYYADIKKLRESKDGADRKQYLRKQIDSRLREAVDKANTAL